MRCTVLLLAMAFAPVVVRAQVRFEWPDTTVDLAKYTTADDCLALSGRDYVHIHRHRQMTTWDDTLPVPPWLELESVAPAEAQDVARCMARFTEPRTDLKDWVPLTVLYLIANRDHDASVVMGRRLAEVPADHVHERTQVTDSIIRLYVTARPSRLDSAEAILLRRAKGDDVFHRLTTYFWLFKESEWHADTVRMQRVGRWMLSLGDSLTPAQRQSDAFRDIGKIDFRGTGVSDGEALGGYAVLLQAVRAVRGWTPYLDSLRRSSAAFIALVREDWRHATQTQDVSDYPPGHHAAPLSADYWFPPQSGAVARPTPGRVSLIVFQDPTKCNGVATSDADVVQDWLCLNLLARARRLAIQFPQLDVTVVTPTHGYFMYATPPAPAEEAAKIREFMAPHTVPGEAVGVSVTSTWRLPAPDGRIIEKPWANYEHYVFGRNFRQPTIALIDTDGTILTTGEFDITRLADLIDILVHRAGT